MDGDYLLVAAIDFGTAYSGYSFSLRSDYERDPRNVFSPQWIPSSGAFVSAKTSTCVLFDQNGKFHSFGFEAEDHYSELAYKDEHHGWCYFRHFKMCLYEDQELSCSLTLKDEQGKAMSAMKVFSSSIKYLRLHLLKECSKQKTCIHETDIKWVITVPAIWGDSAKQFMRKAGELAGIDGKALSIALEPEAASLYCMTLPVELMQCPEGNSAYQVFQPSSKYLVLDAGGGTIDITVHEVEEDGSLKEIYKANGGSWGGTLIDQEYINFLKNAFGEKVFDQFCAEEKVDMLELFRDFELKKRTLKQSMSEEVKFRIPSSLVKIFATSNEVENIQNVQLENTRYSRDKLHVNSYICEKFFKKSIEQIVNHLEFIFDQESVRDVSSIIMVGGYSESDILYNSLKQKFVSKRIIVPQDAGTAVLKGALIFGHEPSKIKTRICRYTYGFGCSVPFDSKIHLPSKRFVNALGQVRCINIFDVHAKCGEAYRVGEPQAEKMYGIGDPNKEKVTFNFYMSSDASPCYTNDPGCRRLGKISVDITDTVGTPDRKVVLYVYLSGTEIRAFGKEKTTGKEVQANFDFLG